MTPRLLHQADITMVVDLIRGALQIHPFQGNIGKRFLIGSLSAACRQLISSLSAAYRVQANSTNSELVPVEIPTFNLRQHILGWSQSCRRTTPCRVNPCTQANVNAYVIRSFAIPSCDVITNSSSFSPLSLKMPSISRRHWRNRPMRHRMHGYGLVCKWYATWMVNEVIYTMAVGTPSYQ